MPEDRVIEECSELIQIICKAKRFGYTSYNPDDPERLPNYHLICNEIEDVLDTIKEYKKWLVEKLRNECYPKLEVI